jgi:hypothetical protein
MAGWPRLGWVCRTKLSGTVKSIFGRSEHWWDRIGVSSVTTRLFVISVYSPSSFFRRSLPMAPVAASRFPLLISYSSSFAFPFGENLPPLVPPAISIITLRVPRGASTIAESRVALCYHSGVSEAISPTLRVPTTSLPDTMLRSSLA